VGFRLSVGIGAWRLCCVRPEVVGVVKSEE